MDKQTVLKNIKATQERLAVVITEKYKEGIPILENAAKLDLKPYIDLMADELEKSFGYWRDAMDDNTQLGHVHLEWSYNDYGAYAYGFIDAEITPETGTLTGFHSVEFGECLFDDNSGFGVSHGNYLKDTESKDFYETEWADYQTTKVAEIFWYAMEKAVQTDTFRNLSKANQITFELCRHDRWAILGYVQ
jgi:hypothetical protein